MEPLEQRILEERLAHDRREANMTYHVARLHPENWYLKFREYQALNDLTERDIKW